MQSVEERLNKIYHLPFGADIFPEIFKLLNDPNKSMLHFEKIVKKDPALSSQVLKVINSPYYGLHKQVTNLRQALALLGLNELHRILLNVSYYNRFQKIFTSISYDLDLYWNHFETTAAAAQVLAEEYLPENSAEAYLIGLLHDSGKLLLDQFLPEEWHEVVKIFSDKKERILELERRVFGYTHSDIAAMLFERWNFPDIIYEPVKFHHYPLAAPNFSELTALVYVADRAAILMSEHQLSREVTQESGEPDENWKTITTMYPHLNILDDEKRLEEFQEKLKTRIYQQYNG